VKRPSCRDACAQALHRSATSAPASAHQQLGESPDRRGSWTSVAEGNCVVERRGGEQPDAKSQPINKTKLNPIRPDTTASLLVKDEAPDRKPIREGQGDFGSPRCFPAGAAQGRCRVVGDGTVGSWGDVKRGTRPGKGGGVHLRERSEEPQPGGVRVLVVVKKRGNARGAKGDRKVEA
jgi:hypothetical protein